MCVDQETLLKLGYNAKTLLADNKGILAIDESPSSIAQKFEKNDIQNNEKTRFIFRELLVTTPNIEKYISGVILHEEMFSMKNEKEKLLIDVIMDKNILIGIKLDKGLQKFDGNEKISVGLEDLENRIQQKKFEKALFAKWRSLFIVSHEFPTLNCLDENCKTLAQYASICQKYGKVPIVEPELYFKGDYELHDAKYHTKRILGNLIKHLNYYNVYIPGVIIKMSFVTQGDESKSTHSPDEIGIATLDGLLSTIPCGIPGIVFLSGGHNENDAIEYLSSIHRNQAYKTWDVSFSFGRTLTDTPMEIWKGLDENRLKAQEALFEIAKRCYDANSQKKMKQ